MTGRAAPAPLDDPAYTPQHPPAGGDIPAVVERWGPRSQVRWFRRFRGALGWLTSAVAGRHYTMSVEHLGDCCGACLEPVSVWEVWEGPGCCCFTGQEVGGL